MTRLNKKSIQKKKSNSKLPKGVTILLSSLAVIVILMIIFYAFKNKNDNNSASIIPIKDDNNTLTIVESAYEQDVRMAPFTKVDYFKEAIGVINPAGKDGKTKLAMQFLDKINFKNLNDIRNDVEELNVNYDHFCAWLNNTDNFEQFKIDIADRKPFFGKKVDNKNKFSKFVSTQVQQFFQTAKHKAKLRNICFYNIRYIDKLQRIVDLYMDMTVSFVADAINEENYNKDTISDNKGKSLTNSGKSHLQLIKEAFIAALDNEENKCLKVEITEIPDLSDMNLSENDKKSYSKNQQELKTKFKELSKTFTTIDTMSGDNSIDFVPFFKILKKRIDDYQKLIVGYVNTSYNEIFKVVKERANKLNENKNKFEKYGFTDNDKHILEVILRFTLNEKFVADDYKAAGNSGVQMKNILRYAVQIDRLLHKANNNIDYSVYKYNKIKFDELAEFKDVASASIELKDNDNSDTDTENEKENEKDDESSS